jgi:hypothetical protein
MELLSGHEKIITKSGISLNAGTLNWGFTVLAFLSPKEVTIRVIALIVDMNNCFYRMDISD